LGADALIGREFVGFLDKRPMAVVAPLWAGPISPKETSGRRDAGKALTPEELWRMRPFPTVMNNSGFRTRHDELGLGGFGLKGRS
jgi:hypothetical protein